MLNDGWWVGDNYTTWQPSGCMPHDYTPHEMSKCLNHSRVLYIGDSIMREQFTAMTSFIPDMKLKRSGPSKHSDRMYSSEKYGMSIELWWDPYLNQSRTLEMLNKDRGVFSEDEDEDDVDVVDDDRRRRASLLIIGSGPWYMKNLGDRYFDDWKVAVDHVMDAVEKASHVADAVMLSPVEVPQYDLLSPERGDTITADKIHRMNTYLRGREQTLMPKTPFVIPYVWNTVGSSTTNMTEDGLHYLSGVTSIQASLALNYRCNNELPKHFPFDTTCCTRYPTPSWLQIMLLVFFLIRVPIGYVLLNYTSPNGYCHRIASMCLFLPSMEVLASLFIFGLGVVYMYIGDRTHLFGKVFKLFDASIFGWLLVIPLVGAILTLRTKDQDDQGFLNRAQTDEWKGWMQIIILVYHFMDAIDVPAIYNIMRVLVAAYLFQTGYGHFSFFYKKGDFGFARVFSILLRLNLLTVVLVYVMDTDYLSYYFTPLVTFWFGVIWVTMFVGHTHNQSKPWFLLGKIVVMGLLTGVLIHADGVLEAVFSLLEVVFNVHWDVDMWRFRMALDAWIVYIGMLFAYGVIHLSDRIERVQHQAWLLVKVAAAVISIAALTWYFYFERSLPSKQAYTSYHPYLSWIPIIAFIVLRNATKRLRNTTLGLFEFVGKCSLETYIGQFHMWLAADTKGLLVVLTNPSWVKHGTMGWWINLAVSSVVFILVCYHLNRTTSDISQWICASSTSSSASATTDQQHRSSNYQHVPLLPTSSTPSSDDDDDDDDNDQAVWHEKPTISRWTLIWQDLRFKAALILTCLAILNHLCS